MSTLRVPVTDEDHSTGPADAPVTLVEYGDYQCSFCGEAFPIVKELLRRFDGGVRFVFRNFPLAEIHPEAIDAAFVAEFAGAHGLYWQAHDLLYESQRELGPALYARICDALGLTPTELQDAASKNLYTPRIDADEVGGIRSGVNGTPTFFVDGVRVDEGTPGLEAALTRALAAPRAR